MNKAAPAEWARMELNFFLLVGALLSAIAGCLHIGIIVKGAPWYRFFGAGETMAMASDQGKLWPHVVTFFIAAILFAWAALAVSGAGVGQPLPFLRSALLGITAVYLLRGVAVVPLLVFAPDKATTFLVWSSVVCLAYGIVHAIGLFQVWPVLPP